LITKENWEGVATKRIRNESQKQMRDIRKKFPLKADKPRRMKEQLVSSGKTHPPL